MGGNMKKHEIISAIGAIVLILNFCLGCSSDNFTDSYSPGEPDTPEAPFEYTSENQLILFEVSHTNFALGHTFSGFYIDTAGNVFTFSYDRGDEPWIPRDPYDITETDLLEKFSPNSTLAATLDKNNVAQMRTLIPGAGSGVLSDRWHEFYDYGATVYFAYTYLDHLKIYIPIILLQYGDWMIENPRPEAAELVSWLKTIPVDYWQQ
jgi:hypothetical protein